MKSRVGLRGAGVAGMRCRSVPRARSLRVGLLGLWLVLTAAQLHAHEMSMAEMEVREVSPHEFLWQWYAGSDKRPAADDLTPRWPDSCQAQDNALRCDARGLWGEVSVDGVGARYSAALIKIYWLDGQSRVYTLTASQPRVHLYGAAQDQRDSLMVARAYGLLGVQHILTGFDHLLFVVSLLFLVGFNRRLLYTITAFTLAHSVTLALSSLGLLTLRSPPVEASIALSILLVAGEALHERPTLSRRWPALVAFLFGLVHGLGFAGALKEIGLPAQHLPVALVTFNLGVEAGQLLVLGLAYLVHRVCVRHPRWSALRTPSLYAIGGVAAYWSLARVVAILG